MLNNYSNSGFTLNINGRNITDWGETETPFTHDPIDVKTVLRRGQGGNAIRLDRKNPGRTVTLNIQPGSPDSAFLQDLMIANANIELGYIQIGTLEAAVGSEGAFVNDGSVGRAGTTITDDQFMIEFNVWEGTKGGSNNPI